VSSKVEVLIKDPEDQKILLTKRKGKIVQTKHDEFY